MEVPGFDLCQVTRVWVELGLAVLAFSSCGSAFEALFYWSGAFSACVPWVIVFGGNYDWILWWLGIAFLGEGRNSILHFTAELAFLLQWLKGQETWSSRKIKTVDEIVPGSCSQSLGWECFSRGSAGRALDLSLATCRSSSGREACEDGMSRMRLPATAAQWGQSSHRPFLLAVTQSRCMYGFRFCHRRQPVFPFSV